MYCGTLASVALPDFSFGAMENLGCVTFRETRLLLDPDAVTLDEIAYHCRAVVRGAEKTGFVGARRELDAALQARMEEAAEQLSIALESGGVIAHAFA